MTHMERVLISLACAFVFWGVLVGATAYAQDSSGLAKDIERLERQLDELRTLLVSNTTADAVSRQDGFTRLGIVESQVEDLRAIAAANRNLFYGVAAGLFGTLLLNLMTFQRVRKNGMNRSA